jgi:hypothetical protein
MAGYMTQDEIIKMYLEVSNKLCNGTEWCWAGVGEPLQLFTKLVAEKEREACAEIAEKQRYAMYISLTSYPPQNGTAVGIANLIRARGQAC